MADKDQDIDIVTIEDIVNENNAIADKETGVTESDDTKIDTIEDSTAEISTEVKKVDTKIDMESDYKYTREVLYVAAEKAQDLLEGVSDLAREAEHPRAYEVAAGVVETLTNSVEKLVKLQKEMKALKNDGPKNVTIVTNNTLNMNSKDLLQAFLKKKDK